MEGYNKSVPYVVAINSVSGGGKTALAAILHQSLPSSILHCFDDYDQSNIYPDDFHQWWKDGADLRSFDFPDMAKAVLHDLENTTKNYLILDYPFGRDHPRFAKLIDLSVFIDTPLDIALARRILRDHFAASHLSAEEHLKQLRQEITHYLEKARHPFQDTYKHKVACDLILDGQNSLEEMKNAILSRLAHSLGADDRHAL